VCFGERQDVDVVVSHYLYDAVHFACFKQPCGVPGAYAQLLLAWDLYVQRVSMCGVRVCWLGCGCCCCGRCCWVLGCLACYAEVFGDAVLVAVLLCVRWCLCSVGLCVMLVQYMCAKPCCSGVCLAVDVMSGSPLFSAC
jgi:hypothetical protein